MTGKFGLLLKETSFFSDEVEEEFLLADDDEREEALEFLISNFDEVDEGLQLQMAFAFGDILSNQPNCYEKGYKTVTRTISETVPNPAYVKPKEGQKAVAGVPKMLTKNKIVTEEDKNQVTCKRMTGLTKPAGKKT